jgi:hypothetical protein
MESAGHYSLLTQRFRDSLRWIGFANQIEQSLIACLDIDAVQNLFSLTRRAHHLFVDASRLSGKCQIRTMTPPVARRLSFSKAYIRLRYDPSGRRVSQGSRMPFLTPQQVRA